MFIYYILYIGHLEGCPTSPGLGDLQKKHSCSLLPLPGSWLTEPENGIGTYNDLACYGGDSAPQSSAENMTIDAYLDVRGS